MRGDLRRLSVPLSLASAAPIQADKDGKYPVPMPGKTTKREF